MPFWNNEIAPRIKKGERVIIAAHGNSLRALVKHLDNISDDQIVELNIPTGIPLVYELDDDAEADQAPLLSGRPRSGSACGRGRGVAIAKG